MENVTPDFRELFLNEAQAELDATEGRAGPEAVSAYRHEAGLGPNDGKHWCGIFCLAMLHRAGLALARKWKIGGGFCEEAKLEKVRTPKPGDIAVFQKNWHHCIVTAVDPKASTFDSIDGNQGSHPPRAGEETIKVRRGRGLRTVFAFYSIDKFVAEALEGHEAWEPETKSETPESKADTQPPAAEPTLRVGDKGTWIALLQGALVDRGMQGKKGEALVDIVTDGKFGPVTESAVARFQAGHSLVVDGVVGPRTWNALLRE